MARRSLKTLQWYQEPVLDISGSQAQNKIKKAEKNNEYWGIQTQYSRKELEHIWPLDHKEFLGKCGR